MKLNCILYTCEENQIVWHTANKWINRSKIPQFYLHKKYDIKIEFMIHTNRILSFWTNNEQVNLEWTKPEKEIQQANREFKSRKPSHDKLL